MRDDGFNPVYVQFDSDQRFKNSDNSLLMNEIIGKKNENIIYNFESTFPPYKEFTGESLEKIDLVVLKGNSPFRSFEVKLTVVPDSVTVTQNETKWGPEMVIRPVSSAYAMMSVATRLRSSKNSSILKQVIDILKPVYGSISGWSNITEINSKKEQLLESLSRAINVTLEIQSPFLIQPIWKTQGQSFKLCNQCFDVFVWSDVAIMGIPIERLGSAFTQRGVSRHLREVARHVKALYEVCTTGHFQYQDTYGGMSLGCQTDKSFSISGKVTRTYLNHKRLLKPIYSSDILNAIVLNGGEKLLKPERRFDAAVVAQICK